MTVEISGLPGKTVQDTGDNSSVTPTKTNGRQSATPANPAAGQDRVSLTSSATQLQELENKIASLPVVDTQRVSNVQRAMATGTLQLNEANAADNLLAMEKSFSE